MLRYIFIGGCTTLLDYLVYQAMVLFLHADITSSNFISAVLAILFAYLTNKFFVFVSRASSFSEHAAEFIKFMASRLFTLVLELTGVFLLVNVLGQDYRIGKGLTIVVVIIINYILSKFLVFGKNKRTQHE